MMSVSRLGFTGTMKNAEDCKMPHPAPSAVLMALLASGCGGAPEPAPAQILCRPQGSVAFVPVCAMDRADHGVIILRKPDGGFRRIRVVADARAVIAADGAEPASVRISAPSEIEISIGGDAFRLPATLKGRPFAAP